MNQESLKGTHQKNIERKIDLEAWGRWKEKGKWKVFLRTDVILVWENQDSTSTRPTNKRTDIWPRLDVLVKVHLMRHKWHPKIEVPIKVIINRQYPYSHPKDQCRNKGAIDEY